ncbi:Jerky protein-like protein-like, partial [Camponotus floridanus]
KNTITTMFCINVTGNHKLPPITGEVSYDDQTLEEDVATKGSKEFAFWYNNLFKKSMREHQLKENITGKVLLLVENWTQSILSEDIMQDDDFEIIILPINTVSIFKPLYPDSLTLINEVNRIFENYMLQRIDKLTNCYKNSLVKEFNRSYNINFHISAIIKSWHLVKTENMEESWRKFLELLQGLQTQEDL